MNRIITNSMIGDFENYLRSDEKSDNTIEKYLRDVKAFTVFAEAREVSKAVVMEFKASLAENYEITSANSMIAAVNAFLRFMGWVDCCIKQFKVQKKSVLFRRKGIDESGVYPPCKYSKRRGQRKIESDTTDNLWNRHPCQRITVYCCRSSTQG